jgi:hypothetical protein
MESKEEKQVKALCLFIESVIKPDNELRSDAHEQECFYELMEWREEILNYLNERRKNF